MATKKTTNKTPAKAAVKAPETEKTTVKAPEAAKAAVKEEVKKAETVGTKTAVAAKSEETAPAKKAAAPKAAPKTAKAAKAPRAAKTVKTAKTAGKTTAASKVKKPAVKKAEKELDIALLTENFAKKFGRKNVSKIGETVAVEVKVYGEFEGFFYILAEDGKLTIAPYNYDDCDVHVDIPVKDVLSIIDGKYDFKAKVLSGDLYATGIFTKAFKIKTALFGN